LSRRVRSVIASFFHEGEGGGEVGSGRVVRLSVNWRRVAVVGFMVAGGEVLWG